MFLRSFSSIFAAFGVSTLNRVEGVGQPNWEGWTMGKGFVSVVIKDFKGYKYIVNQLKKVKGLGGYGCHDASKD